MISEGLNDYCDDDINIPTAKKIKSNRNALEVSSDSSDDEQVLNKPVANVYQAQPIRGIFSDVQNLNAF